MRKIKHDWISNRLKFLKHIEGEKSENIILELKDSIPLSGFSVDFPQDMTSEEKSLIAKQIRGSLREYSHLNKNRLQELLHQTVEFDFNTKDQQLLVELLIEHLIAADQAEDNSITNIVEKKIGYQEFLLSLLPLVKDEDETISYNAVKALYRLKINGQSLNNDDLLKKKITEHMKHAFDRASFSSNSRFYLIRIINDLADTFSKDFVSLYKGIIDACNPKLGDYREVESCLYFTRECFNKISPNWSNSMIKEFSDSLITTAKSELNPGDYWVHENILSTLKIVGKDIDSAQKAMEWIESEYKKKNT